jgi:putative ABC transport system permease protein
LGSGVPFGGDDYFRRVAAVDGPAPELEPDIRAVTEDYFEIFEMPLVAGRAFSREGPSPVGAAIVNETAARKLGGDVLGRRIKIDGAVASLPAYEIVGIIADARSSGTTTNVRDEVYIPLGQSNPSILYVIVASTVDPVTLDPVIRRELRAVLPDRVDDPMVRLTAMETVIDQALARPRFSATLISVYSAAALVLAAIGIFALIAYSVTERRPELGLRAALGADSRRLLLMILNSTFCLVAVGIGLGLVVAIYLSRFVASQLYGVDALDLPTLVVAAGVMLAVAAAAAFIPACRAALVDPTIALRCE